MFPLLKVLLDNLALLEELLLMFLFSLLLLLPFVLDPLDFIYRLLAFLSHPLIKIMPGLNSYSI